MKKIGIFIGIGLCFFGNAQEKFQSLATLDVLTGSFSFNPRINAGFIQKIDERVWVGVDVGYGNAGLIGTNHRIRENYQLFEVRPEVYYDLRPSTKLKHLVSIEPFYIKHTDTFKNSWFQQKGGNFGLPQNYKYQQADYKRIKIGANINYNLLYYFGKRFGLMQKVGIGIRNRNVQYNNIVGLEQDYSKHYSTELSGSNYRIKAGNEVGINLNLAFRFFYKF
ncbi:MAG: hypothetical protein CSA38_05230 [Flavobacteriales bacterium]|nr:MAG: hypothetical protein CSA38_05230 [Flavobacteriales bacterium]